MVEGGREGGREDGLEMEDWEDGAAFFWVDEFVSVRNGQSESL